VPITDVSFFAERDGSAPVLDWLRRLRLADRSAYARCVAAIERLAAFGFELRRPTADYLERGLYELRVRKGRVQLRLLCFFHGRNCAVLVSAFAKQAAIPAIELLRARARMQQFRADPVRHTRIEQP
jgi:hypothetical protein